MGNTTWKNDNKHFGKRIVDSYSFISCSHYLWIVYSIAEKLSVTSYGVTRYVHQMQLEDIFSSIVAGDDVEHAKPAPDMVFKALKEMKGTADETLVVGDMNFDVDMAHHAGCKACAVTYGNGTREQLASAEWIIDDFAELLEIVKE